MVKQHNSKSIDKLFKQLTDIGFSVSEKSKRGSVKITPPASIGGSPYFTHATESSLHYLRRDVKKMYKVEVK